MYLDVFIWDFDFVYAFFFIYFVAEVFMEEVGKCFCYLGLISYSVEVVSYVDNVVSI